MNRRPRTRLPALVVALAALGAGTARSALAYVQPRPADYSALSPAAGSAVLYEVQVRSANACRTDTGADWQRAACAAKLSPATRYRAFGGDRSRCGLLDDLEKIRLGTLDDLTEDTSDYRAGITLRYIKEKVGATAVWLMPVFPNNDRWNLPDACDNLGSPYAVRDYMHASGSLDRACIRSGLDENSTEDGGDRGCWGNGALDQVISQAHRLGLKVMLDVAFNHFGHNYRFYDAASFRPVRERIGREDLDGLWNYAATFEPALVHPDVLDTVPKIEAAAARDALAASDYRAVRARCPELSGDLLVRAFNMWRVMLDWERARFSCSSPMYLEYAAPGFYLGARGPGDPRPSAGVGDNFTNNWTDVKFLYHHEYHGGSSDAGRGDFYDAFVRNREYLFRVLNWWASRGIDGFRLDHTTDPDSGMGPNEWKYVLGKVNYYDWVRKGRPRAPERLIFLAEEFGDQQGMNHVVDAMTEGYVGDMCARDGETKDASFVERVLSNDARFGDHAYVMRALETHDEKRLLEGTGFDLWTGAGFWGIGATNRGMAMLLMGQEFGESWGLGFRRSSYLPSRFMGTANYQPQGDALAEFYRKMNAARLDPSNRALLSGNRWFLRTRSNDGVDPRIFAQAKWSDDGNVVFTFHNLWPTDDPVAQSYYLPPLLAGRLGIQDSASYRLVDVFTGQAVAGCRSGADLKWNLYVSMPRSMRLQWLRLELCQ